MFVYCVSIGGVDIYYDKIWIYQINLLFFFCISCNVGQHKIKTNKTPRLFVFIFPNIVNIPIRILRDKSFLTETCEISQCQNDTEIQFIKESVYISEIYVLAMMFHASFSYICFK